MRGATRHQESATDAGPVYAEGTFASEQAGRRGPGPSADVRDTPGPARAPRPAPRALHPAPAPPHLQQQFDPLDGGDRGLGDGSGDAAGQEVLEEAPRLVTHGDSRAHTASGSRALALARARPGTAAPSPTLRDAEGPLASPRSPPYIPRAGSRERRRARGPARGAHWLGRCGDPPSPPRSPAEGIGGEGASARPGWAGGCAPSLGRLKGTFVLSVPGAEGTACLGGMRAAVFIA